MRTFLFLSCALFVLACGDSKCPTGTKQAGTSCLAISEPDAAAPIPVLDGGREEPAPEAGTTPHDASAAQDASGCAPRVCSGFGLEHFDPVSCACEPCASQSECMDALLCAPGVGCVECTAEHAEVCTAQQKVCSTDQRCVECNSSSDCTHDAGKPVCDLANHACVPCGAEHACESNRICVEQAGPFQGHCVGCTAEDRSQCAVDELGHADVCNALTLECEAGVKEGSGRLCGSHDQRSCVSSAECPAGSVCVQEFLKEQAFDSWHCMPLQGSALCKQPFAREQARPTIEGTSAELCTLSLSTCAAHAQYRNTPCADDEDPSKGDDRKCGLADVDDGYCAYGGSVLGWRCSVPCGNDVIDCPESASSCDASRSPDVCAL